MDVEYSSRVLDRFILHYNFYLLSRLSELISHTKLGPNYFVDTTSPPSPLILAQHKLRSIEIKGTQKLRGHRDDCIEIQFNCIEKLPTLFSNIL